MEAYINAYEMMMLTHHVDMDGREIEYGDG